MIGLWWFSTHTRHTDEYLITISITKIVDSSMMMMMTWNSFIHWFSNFFHWIQLCCAFVFIFWKMNLFFHFSMTKSPLFHPTCLLLFVHCKWNEIPLFTRSIESVTLLLLTWINEWISDFFFHFFSTDRFFYSDHDNDDGITVIIYHDFCEFICIICDRYDGGIIQSS